MLFVTTCIECSAELAPEWKFCIRCGAAVSVLVEPEHAQGHIPGAIRPDLLSAENIPVISPLALFGWSLGGILVAFAVVGGVLAIVYG
jgi:hypothetical protein